MEINNMESKLEYFLDNGSIFEMFEIQKDGNKIYQKDRYSPSKTQCCTLGLLCTALFAAITSF